MSLVTIQQALDAAIAHHKAGRLQAAERIYRQILEHEPENADVLHLLGALASKIGRPAMAMKLIGQAIAANPDVAYFHNDLGIVLRDEKRPDEAITSCRRALQFQPAFAEAHNNLANALKDKGELDQAISSYRQAIQLKPDYAEAHYNLGNTLQAKGQPDEAIASYRQALQLNPDHAQAHNNLGVVLKMNGEFDQAIISFQRAIQLKPDGAEVYCNLGSTFKQNRQLPEAIAAFQHAIQLKHDYAKAHCNLADALDEIGQLDRAIVFYEHAIKTRPDYFEAHNNLGIAVQKKGQLDRAIAAYQRALQLKPDYAEAQNNLGNALRSRGEFDNVTAAYRRAVQLQPDFAATQSNLLYSLMFHPGYDAASILAEHLAWADRYTRPLMPEILHHGNDPTTDRPLRIGYVSHDLRRHPVGRFLLPLLANHDREQFEIHCYSDVRNPDVVTASLKACCDHWHDITGASDAILAEQIRLDGIDILLDLSLHMAHNRLLAFARKPAPVQVTWLAYAGTSGLAAMDYRLSDPYLDPLAKTQAIYAEKTIHIPSYWCFEPALSPTIAALPALQAGHITFGCLNNFAKVSPMTLDLWAAVLREVRGSRLLIHSHPGTHRDKTLHTFARVGIDPARITFVGGVALEEYLRQYDQIDIALDTTPYAGGTTTCDALWMGVPTVTLSGKTAVGRGGVSLLSNLGIPELIADSAMEYVRIAADLAKDIDRLAALRSSLRPRMLASSLMNGKSFTGSIEAAYRRIWVTWCNGAIRRQ